MIQIVSYLVSAWGEKVDSTDCGNIGSMFDLSGSGRENGNQGYVKIEKCISECKTLKSSRHVLFGRVGKWSCKSGVCKCLCGILDCDPTSPSDHFDMYTVVY